MPFYHIVTLLQDILTNSESTNYDPDSDVQTEDDDNTESEDCETDDEVWTDVPERLLQQDILSAPPLPDPVPKQSKVHLVSSIVRWLLYFILIWQGVCHVSDNGLAWLLRFLLQFFKAINVHVAADILTELIAIFPTSLFMVRQLLDLDRDNFTKYVVCPKCTTCYDYNQCVVNVNGRHVVKRFYSRGKSQPCNAQLVNKVTLKNNVSKYYPIYYYCYTGIINSLEKLVQKNGFPEKCEEWRSRGHGDGDLLTDVYDAKLWKDFMKYENVDFLNTPRNYGLMLNFDFFQPMKHRKDYSVGVLYLVLLNLPRAERFKWENVIVVGIIPAMGHEPKTLNIFETSSW